MEGIATRAASPSLSESFAECIQLFGKFLLVLGEKDCRVIHLKHIRLPGLLEEYGRVKIWGDQTKADLPAMARGSLDDILRHDNELKDLVHAILVRLGALLDRGK